MCSTLDVADDVREDVADRRTDESEDDDNDNGDEHKDQRVFDETLTFFAGHVQHDELLNKDD